MIESLLHDIVFLVGSAHTKIPGREKAAEAALDYDLMLQMLHSNI